MRTQQHKGEFATFQGGGLMQQECAERGENEGYGETHGSQHAICADLSKDPYLTLCLLSPAGVCRLVLSKESSFVPCDSVVGKERDWRKRRC